MSLISVFPMLAVYGYHAYNHYDLGGSLSLIHIYALAISKDDATAPARILAKYAKDVKAVKLVAGVVEDKYYDEAGIKALADIPAREVLLGRLLGSMQSPIANFARVIKQIAEKDGEASAEA